MMTWGRRVHPDEYRRAPKRCTGPMVNCIEDYKPDLLGHCSRLKGDPGKSSGNMLVSSLSTLIGIIKAILGLLDPTSCREQ